MKRIVIFFVLTCCLLLAAGCNKKQNINIAAAPDNKGKTIIYRDETRPWVDVIFDKNEVLKLQKDVDNGHQPGMTDPEQAAWDFANNILDIEKITESELKTDNEGTKTVTITTGEKMILEVQLTQMAEKGVHGVWTVIRYRCVN